MPRCAQCSELCQTPKHCGACKVVIYCSKECQRANWATHKLSCAKQQKPAADVPPVVELKQAPPTAAEGRPPVRAQLPSELNTFTWIPSPDGTNSNLLILFHGLGDTEKRYAELGKQMALPQTAVLALRAPLPLPFEMPGFSWFPSFEEDGELIEGKAKELRRVAGLRRTRTLLVQFVQALLQHSGWSLERIFLMGFSAGAIVAADLALHHPFQGGGAGEGGGGGGARFGGVVAVASCLLPEMALDRVAASRAAATAAATTAAKTAAVEEVAAGAKETPFLIIHGEADDRVPLAQAKDHANVLKTMMGLKSVTLRVYPKKRHEFINSPQEARDVFEFFSSHLHLRNLALEQHPDIIPVSLG